MLGIIGINFEEPKSIQDMKHDIREGYKALFFIVISYCLTVFYHSHIYTYWENDYPNHYEKVLPEMRRELSKLIQDPYCEKKTMEYALASFNYYDSFLNPTEEKIKKSYRDRKIFGEEILTSGCNVSNVIYINIIVKKDFIDYLNNNPLAMEKFANFKI